MKSRNSTALVEHAGSGFLMPEETARRIENLSRGLPRDFTYRRRSAPAAELELNAGERTDVSTITTDALDRDRECVLPGGGDWSAYNRVVPFAHDYRQLPAGSCWWIKPKGGKTAKNAAGTAGAGAGSNGLIAKTHYPAKPADWGDAPWLPSAVLHLMQQPVPTCTGKSIGFLPLNIREATKEELSRRPELAGAPIIDRWAGIEYSVVPVPCNPEAEMLAVAKGVEAGVFDAAVAELITKAMTPYLAGWSSPLGAAEAREGKSYSIPKAAPVPLVPPLARPERSRGAASQTDDRVRTGPQSQTGDSASAGCEAASGQTDEGPAAENDLRSDPPPCPRCGGNAGVLESEQGSERSEDRVAPYTCDYCGTAFDAAPPAAAAEVKETAGVRLHEAGFSHAEALIHQGKVSDAAWSFTAADRRSAKPEDFLGEDQSAAPDTEARWRYPVSKDGTVYRRGVAAAESRAAQHGATSIAQAAGRLMKLIQSADESAAKAEAIERAASAPFVRPETIQAALRRAVEDAKAELPSLIRRELHEAYARATGKV